MDTTTTSTTEEVENSNITFTGLFDWYKKRSATFTEQYINSNGLDNNIDIDVCFFSISSLKRQQLSK